jgi:hypothetical protein
MEEIYSISSISSVSVDDGDMTVCHAHSRNLVLTIFIQFQIWVIVTPDFPRPCLPVAQISTPPPAAVPPFRLSTVRETR